MRGRKPKPLHLHLVDGTFRPTRHGGKAAAAKAKPEFGALRRPSHLKGPPLAVWKRYVDPLKLDGAMEPVAIAWIELWLEFQSAPTRFRPSKHSQMRRYHALMLDQRNRYVKVEEPDEHLDSILN
jgi:phage terminase small subunit